MQRTLKIFQKEEHQAYMTIIAPPYVSMYYQKDGCYVAMAPAFRFSVAANLRFFFLVWGGALSGRGGSLVQTFVYTLTLPNY